MLLKIYLHFAQDQETVNVAQFQVKAWPANGILKNPGLVIHVMESVQAVCRKGGLGPVVVHCR